MAPQRQTEDGEAQGLEERLYLLLRRRLAGRTRDRKKGEGKAGDSTAAAPRPGHLVTGERGEDLAYFHLCRQGYTVVARRWQTPRLRGDLDLVVWDGDTLVFVEVKTRTAHYQVAAEAAVDEEKRRMLRRMARAYRRRLPEPWRERTPYRFDIVSVYDLPLGVEINHIPNAFAAR